VLLLIPEAQLAGLRPLKTCDAQPMLSEARARRAGEFLAPARRTSTADAIVVALAEPHGTVLTSDPPDLEALVTHARGVEVEPV